ncbi:MAG: hypothetical protein ACK5LV_03525 [Lachnospirales bacterium]
MIKAIGLSIIFLSLTKIINFYGQGGIRNIKITRDLILFLVNVKNEVNYFSTPILDTFKNTKSDYFSEFFNNLHNDIEKSIEVDKEFLKCYENFKNKCDYSILKDKIFLNIGKLLYAKDKVDFNSNIDYIIDYLKKKVELEEEKARDDEILYRKLSIFISLAVIIILY